MDYLRLGAFDKAVLVAVTVGVFGPYLGAGIRTEQALIYGTAAGISVLMPWRWLRRGPVVPDMVPLATVWTLYLVVALIGAAFPPPELAPLRGATLAGIDNLLLPLAVVIVVSLTVTPATRSHALHLVAGVLTVAAAANGALALAMTRLDLSRVLLPWWSTGDSGAETTAELAATMGRYSGIFNQPAEAGVLYGVAGLSAVYLWRGHPWRLYPALTLIVVGGSLSVSKVFLLVALPLIAWQMLRFARGKATVGLLTSLAVVWVVQAGWVVWSGTGYLLRLLSPPESGGWVRFYTAGRFGDSSTLAPVIDTVTDASPILGMGAAGLRVPYDNGWVEAYVVAGVFGVVAYSVAVASFLVIASRRAPGLERAFAVSLALLVVGASAGLPALTANRAGAAFWLLLAILAVAQGSALPDPRVGAGTDGPMAMAAVSSAANSTHTFGLSAPPARSNTRGVKSAPVRRPTPTSLVRGGQHHSPLRRPLPSSHTLEYR